MSTTIVPSTGKRRRKNANNSQNITNNTQNSVSKLNSDFWAEVDKFDLVIEKTTRTRSYSIMKNLENDFKSVSTGSQRRSLLASTMPENIDENASNNNNRLLETTTNTKGVCVDPYELNMDDSNEFDNSNLEAPQYVHIGEATSSKLPSVHDNNILIEDLNQANSKHSHIDKSASEKSYASPDDSYIDKIAYRKSDEDPKDSQIDINASGKSILNPKGSNADKIESYAVSKVFQIDKNIACDKSDSNSKNLTIDEAISSKSDNILQNIISKKETSQKKMNLNKSIPTGTNKGKRSCVHSVKSNSTFEHKDFIHNKVKKHVCQTADWLINQIAHPDVIQTCSACEQTGKYLTNVT